MLSVKVAPGLRATGRGTPEMENAPPLTANDLIFTVCVPVDVSVIDCVATVLTATLPKLTLVVLAANWPFF
jgi:hypothetical protein